MTGRREYDIVEQGWFRRTVIFAALCVYVYVFLFVSLSFSPFLSPLFCMLYDQNIPTVLGGKNTALHLAVRQSRTRVVKLLLDQGAVFSKDSGDNTPFELAVKRQLKSVIAVHLEHDRYVVSFRVWSD